MELKEIGWHIVEWHILARDTDEWRILHTLCTVLNPRVPQKAEKLLSGSANVKLPRIPFY